MKVDHDKERKIIAISQGAYARRLLAGLGIDGSSRVASTSVFQS